MRRAIAFAAGGAVVAQWAPAAAAVVSQAGKVLGVPTTLPSDRGVLLSFDDGPHPQGTPAVLAELDRARAPAVFFVSGEQVIRYPELVRDIAAAGHELGLHGHQHQTRRQWIRRAVEVDTQRAIDALSAAAGVVPRLYRPPHGVFTLTGLRLIRDLGLAPLLWSKWGRDWERTASPSRIVRCATTGIEAGDVVLLHDADHYGAPGSWSATAAALPEIAARICTAGLETTSVRPGPATNRLMLTV